MTRDIGYLWWGNIPMYTREEFQVFFEAIHWDRLSWLVYDHAAYLCYLVFALKQPLVHTNTWLEKPHCVREVEGVPLLWRPRGSCKSEDTLLSFHHDHYHALPEFQGKRSEGEAA